jgi:CBS domain-containing protein
METTAKDIMSTDLITLPESATIEEAMKVFFNSRITGLPVVNGKREMIGVLSEYDILRQISRNRKLTRSAFRRRIRFSAKCSTIRTSTPLRKVVETFIRTEYRRLPVVDSRRRLVGIITRRDLMRVFYYRAQLT